MGIMEKKLETTIMENQLEKKMENEMETGIIQRGSLAHVNPVFIYIFSVSLCAGLSVIGVASLNREPYTCR